MDVQMLRAGGSVPCCSQHQIHRALQGHRCRPCTAAGRSKQAEHPRQRRCIITAAAGDNDQVEPSTPQQQSGGNAKPKQKGRRKGKKGPSPAKTVSLTLRRSQQEAEEEAEAFTLDDFNPVAIGKRSRQVFDDVWQQFARLASPSRGSAADDIEYSSPVEEFSSPEAVNTTVLVAGATGRVGRILVRKLLLRGYKVRALVRGRDQVALEAIPQSVAVIKGDIGDYDSCLEAVAGCDKVISCVSARTDLTVDLRRVEELGIQNLARAYMDLENKKARQRDANPGNPNQKSMVGKVRIVDFDDAAMRGAWQMTHVGLPKDNTSSLARRAFDRGQDMAQLAKNEWRSTMIFAGSIYSRGGRAEISGPIAVPKNLTLEGSEGVVLRMAADGNVYTALLYTEEGHSYGARITTRRGFLTARLPFSVFRPEDPSSPVDVDPMAIVSMGLRFDRSARQSNVVVSAEDVATNDFRVELDYIKALPGGREANFVMVSCVGAGLTGQTRRKMVAAKRRGEDVLRASGLGYTIVRPGPLQEEPGGYKALVFDQGNRISHTISCADVADVTLKALHDGAARNKTFEVCSEIVAEPGAAAYELVAHLPDRSNNYLTPALVGLEKNT